MTNEQLVIEIQLGEANLMPALWEQVERFAIKQANKFYYSHIERCISIGIELEDLKQEAYLGIHRAVEKYNADRGVKFLTCAGYYLMSQFYTAAKMHSTGWEKRQEPISLECAVMADDGGNVISLIDVLAAPAAQADIDRVIEREYLEKAKPILERALDRLPTAQRETAINCFGNGLSYAEYGRQRSINRATARQAGERALKNLRADPELAACAY